MSDVNLEGADLRSAKLMDARLDRAELSRATLIGANISGGSFLKAILLGTNLSSTIGNRSRRGNLTNWEGANLSRANLSGAEYKAALFCSADLRSADLSNSYLGGSDFSNAILLGANLDNAKLPNTCLIRTRLSTASLNGVDLTGAELPHAILLRTDLRLASFKNANLRGAILTEADLRSANLHGADLRDSKFSRADLRCVKSMTDSAVRFDNAIFDHAVGLTAQQQTEIESGGGCCNGISADSYPNGFTWNDVVDRLFDLEVGIKSFAEYVFDIQKGLDQLRRPDGLLDEVPPAPEKVEHLEQLVQEMTQITASFQADVEWLNEDLHSLDLDLTAIELREEYENINNQILKVSLYKRVVQEIYIDLPGFIERPFDGS